MSKGRGQKYQNFCGAATLEGLLNETAVLSCLWQENGGARGQEGAQLVRQPKKTDRDENEDKQERIIVTPLSENSYMAHSGYIR